MPSVPGGVKVESNICSVLRRGLLLRAFARVCVAKEGKELLILPLNFSTLPLLSATLNCLNNSGIQPAHTHGSARQSTCAHVCGKQTVLFVPRQSQKLSIKLYFVIPYWFICRVYKPHFLLPTEHVEKNRCPRLKTSRDVASYSCGGGGKGE